MPTDPRLSGLFTDPREFLKMNLVLMRGVLPTASGPYGFRFEDATGGYGARCTRKSKHFWKSDYGINVWDVRLAGETAGGVPAFYLAYQPNQIRRAVVPDDTPFLLTAEMTGCTFGIAKRRNFPLEVCHANYQDGEGKLDTARLAHATSWCTSRLEDSRYRTRIRGKGVSDLTRQAGLGSTIVGVNFPKKGWQFYAQQWENKDGTNFEYHELIEL
jgi:hypothetical protein